MPPGDRISGALRAAGLLPLPPESPRLADSAATWDTEARRLASGVYFWRLRLDGRNVTGLRVEVDRERLEQILSRQRSRPGIVDIQVEIAADTDLGVGDDVMLLVVAGDIRENVIRTLEDTLNAIKSTVTAKTEVFA